MSKQLERVENADQSELFSNLIDNRLSEFRTNLSKLLHFAPKTQTLI